MWGPHRLQQGPPALQPMRQAPSLCKRPYSACTWSLSAQSRRLCAHVAAAAPAAAGVVVASSTGPSKRNGLQRLEGSENTADGQDSMESTGQRPQVSSSSSSSSSHRSKGAGRRPPAAAAREAGPASVAEKAEQASALKQPRPKHPQARQQQQQQQQSPPPPQKQQQEGRQRPQQQQPQRRQQFNRSSTSPPAITKAISSCTTLVALEQAFQVYQPHLNVVHLSALVRRLVDLPPSPMTTRLARQAMQLLEPRLQPGDAPRALANLAWSVSRLGLVDDVPFFACCLEQFLLRLQQANGQEVSSFMVALTKEPQLQQLLLVPGVLPRLLQRMAGLEGAAPSQAIGNALWATAKCLAATDSDNTPAAAAAAAAGGQEEGPSQQVRADAAAASRDPQLQAAVKQLLRNFLQTAGSGAPQELSNVMYALVWLPPCWPPELPLKLLAAFMPLAVAGRASPQGIQNILWALATLQQRGQLPAASTTAAAAADIGGDTQAVAVAGETASGRAGAAAPTPLAAPAAGGSQAWERHASQLLSLLAGRAQEAGAQDISVSLWAAVELQLAVRWPDLEVVMRRVVHQRRRASPQSLANTVWALARLQDSRPDLVLEQQLWYPVEQLADAFADVLHKAKPQEVANMLWACSRLQHLPGKLLSAWYAAGASQVAGMTAQGASNVAWALGRFGVPPAAELMAPVVARALHLLSLQPQPQKQRHHKQHHKQQRQLEGLAPGGKQERLARMSQECANVPWAVCVLDQQALIDQLQPFATAFFGDPAFPTNMNGCRQWYQVHLWLRDVGWRDGKGILGFQGITQGHLDRCTYLWATQQDLLTSHTQQDVYTVVHGMPDMEMLGLEQPDQLDGALFIDIVVKFMEVLMALEVDGPVHYLWPQRVPTGDTRARNRALQKRGYAVVVVAVDEWWGLKTAAQRTDYLRVRMTAAAKAAAGAAADAGPVIQAADAAGSGTETPEA